MDSGRGVLNAEALPGAGRQIGDETPAIIIASRAADQGVSPRAERIINKVQIVGLHAALIECAAGQQNLIIGTGGRTGQVKIQV